MAEPVRNLITNPSFETNLDGLQSGTGTGAPQRVQTSTPAGAHVAQFQVSGAASNTGWVMQEITLPAGAAGKYLGFSALTRRVTGATETAYLRAWGRDEAGNNLPIVSLTDRVPLTAAPIADQERLTGAFQVQPGAVSYRLYVWCLSPTGGAPANGTLFTDAWIATLADTEQQALTTAGTYFDGDTPDRDTRDVVWVHSWNGPAHASASTAGPTALAVRPMPTVSVTTGGQSREVTSVDITRQIPSLGRGHLGIPGGLLATTAAATMPEQDDVAGRAKTSPWDRVNNFPPIDGDTATVDVDNARRFTGVVEDATGGAYADLAVDMVDTIDRLHRPISLDPLATEMPTRLDSRGIGRIEHISLRPEWYVYQALRAADFHPVPPPHRDALRHIPMVGSLVAADGTMPTNAPPTAGAPLHVQQTSWAPAPWGLAVRGVHSAWDVGQLTSGDAECAFYATGPATEPDPLTVRFNPTGDALNFREFLEVSFPSTGMVRFAYRQHPADSPTVTTVTRDDTRLIRRTQTGTSWQLHYGDDTVMQGTSSESLSYSRVLVTSPDGCQVHIGPLYVGAAGRAVDDSRAPNATLRCGTLLTGPPVAAGPYLENVSAIDLLQQVARGQSASVWLDSNNHLHYAHPDAQEAQEPTATITADADILDVSWSTSVRDVAHKVHLSCRSPLVTATGRDQVVLYQGSSGRSISAEDAPDREFVFEGWATPAPGVDWLTHDVTSADRRTSIHSFSESSFRGFNRGGTWWGTAIINDDNTERTALIVGSTSASMEMEQVTSQAIRYRMTLMNTASSLDSVATKIASTKFPESAEDLVGMNSQGLPILRGMGTVEWSTVRHVSEVTGPESATDYDHDAGPWVQGTTCQALANWLGERMTTPRPLLQDLPIVYRPDLDLGQVITLTENVVYDISLRCLVTGLRERHTPDQGAQMWVTLRVLEETP